MKGEKKNKFLLRIVQIFAVAAIMFGITSISANASCSHKSCDCKGDTSVSSCATPYRCVGDYPSGCKGHSWHASTSESGWHTTVSPWCEKEGKEENPISYYAWCDYCDKTYNWSETQSRKIDAWPHAGFGPWRDEGGVHAHYCTRCSGNREQAPHRYNYWDHYDINGLHYSNCLDCGHYTDAVYSFTVYFNPNGGTLIGSSSKTMAGGSSKHTLGTSARRTGYSFMGWGTSPVWGGARYDVTEQKQAYQWAQIFGKSIQHGDNYGTFYAQWERKITYKFYYWNGKQGTQITSSVTWHNGEDTNNRTMTIPNVARGDKDRLGQTWTFDGFDLDPSLKYTEEDLNKFTDVICDIDDTTSELSIPIGDLNVNYDKNYYTKYHTTVTMTYVDYGTDKQITRTSSKVSYMNWDYSSHTKPSFKTLTESIMYYTEASAKCNHSYDGTNGDDNSNNEYTRCDSCVQEKWNSTGWAFENTKPRNQISASVVYAQGASVPESVHDNVNRTLYGLYDKNVTLTFNLNGGVELGTAYNNTTGMLINTSASNNKFTYTRYANAYNVSQATTEIITLPEASYKASSGVTKYNFGSWTDKSISADNNFDNSTNNSTDIVGKNVSVSNMNWESRYIPRVSETIYASWTNQTAQTSIEPKVTVKKTAVWKTPTSDNSAVDFDNLQNIDIDGRVVVTLDITVENKNGYKLTNLNISDFINTDMWVYVSGAASQSSNVDRMTYTQENGDIYLTLSDTSATSTTYKATYELQLKENYWNVIKDSNLYINKIPNLTKYLASVKSDGTLDYSNMYYCESVESERAYVKASYFISNGRIRSTQRDVHYATPYVVMRQVNWTPVINSSSNKELDQLSISSGTNVYHNIDASYYNTYFVQYDTKSSDSSNSTFNIFSNSSIRRSYETYQITDNLLDIRTVNGNNQVIDNNIGLNVTNSTTIKDTTSSDANTTQDEVLKISSGENTHNAVTAVNNANYYTVQDVTAKILAGGNVVPAWIGQRGSEADFKYERETTIKGKPAVIWTKKVYQAVKNYGVSGNVEYKYGGLTSVSTLYATNQDGLEMNIYPYVRTTNSILNKTYETTRNTNTLQNQRLNITIDASDPIITPDSNIKTSSDEYGEWTESDGYMDINLVNSATNPTAQTHTLVFGFEDKVSGVNSPYATNEDWINTTSDNIYVTLKRIDNDAVTIYDSEVDKTNANNSVVKITYDSTSTMNKTGNIKVVLDPENEDLLGHLQLTIRVYDNVSNWTEKVYDIYVFCLTGAVEIADTLPDYNARLLELDRFANGELGFVKVSAGGYVDRVTVDFDAYLEKLYSVEINTRKNFLSDTVTSINGDYPNTDARNVGTSENSSMTYLPYSMQVNTWGYTDDTLGGLKVTEVALNKYTQTVNNSILKEHLSDLIERYQGMNQGASYDVEKGSDYAIVGSTLYTYPIMNGDSITSYADKYELGGETYYDDVLYPAYVTLDGTKGITITYESVAPDIKESDDTTIDGDDTNSDNTEVEENELRRKIVASVEDTTQIILSNWVQVGDGYLRPFMHYFYMPLDAEEKTASNPYYVTLTSYKDSEKDFKHHVSIRVSFYNDIEAIHKKLETYIKDN